MAKKSNQEIADAVFKKYPDAQKVSVSSDGHGFLSLNAANLHKDTSGKKGITVTTINRTEKVKEVATETQPVKLDKLKLAELIKVAELKGIRPEAKATKKQLIELIETVEKAKIIE